MMQHTGLKPEEIIEYLRKSRADDALLTVEEVLQKHETILDEWAENNLGGKVPEENKFREVVSGETIDDRPEIKEVLNRIESPRIKGILVVEVQRLSRGDLEDAGRLIKLLRYTNTLVITPQKTFDLRDEYDREFFERELKRGNEFLEYQKKIMNRGRILSVQQGNYLGSKPPHGYDRTWVMDGKRKCPTLKINEQEANIVRLIFDLYVNQNMGFKRIANHLEGLNVPPPKGKFWSPPTIQDMIENVHYIGKVKWNFRKTVNVVTDGEILKKRPKAQKVEEYLICEGKHPAIIPDDLFAAAQAKRGRNSRAKASTKLRNPFAGLIFCTCGRAMTLRYYKHPDGSERSPARLVCENQARCNVGSCLFTEMTEEIKTALKQCIEDFEVRVNGDNKDAIKLHANLIKSLEKKMEELDQKELNLWDTFSEKGMPQHIFDKLNADLLQEKDDVKNALCKAKETLPEPVDYEEKLHRFRDALNALMREDISVEEKNSLLKSCIGRITYDRQKPERIKSTAKRVTVNGKRIKPDGLPVGGNWTSYPIKLDVQLKV